MTMEPSSIAASELHSLRATSALKAHSPATYVSPTSTALTSPEAVGVWLERARALATTRAIRRGVLDRAEEQIGSLHLADSEGAHTLGCIVGGARAEGAPLLTRLLARPELANEWVDALLAGVVETWRQGLEWIALRAGRDSVPRMTAALGRCRLAWRDAPRQSALKALASLAERGVLPALEELEHEALREDLDAEASARAFSTFFEGGKAALRAVLEDARDVQPAVDVAVALVDVSMKLGRTTELDALLGSLNPAVLPTSVTMAFLTTSKPLAEDLLGRATLLAGFETALNGRGLSADRLLRFVR
ncbi:MAG: hypothetical protein R3B36_36545 [Polyangiaceae bacterium]